MTTLIKVSRLRDALISECRDCGERQAAAFTWSLSSTQWLHTSGTGHKRFTLYGLPQTSEDHARTPS